MGTCDFNLNMLHQATTLIPTLKAKTGVPYLCYVVTDDIPAVPK